MFLILFALSAFLIWYLWLRPLRNFEKYLNDFPGPTGLPFIGNVLDVSSISQLIPTFLGYIKKYGGTIKLSLGVGGCGILATDYNLLEFILSSTKIITKSREYLFLERWLAKGLLTSNGIKWQKRRKLLTPAFHFQILEQSVDVFTCATDIMVKKLRQEVGKPSTNIYPYITLCSLDIISESAMGIKINAQENENSSYVRAVKEMGIVVINRTMSVIKQFEFLYKMSRDYQKEKKALKVLHGTTDSVIKKRKEALAQTGTLENVDEFGKKKKLAFLDLLLSAKIDGQPLSDKDIREEVDTFMFEGHDTTSSGIAFALYNLSKHPDIQDKVVQELNEIFGGDLSKNPSYKDLQEMKYLEMVIKESMRLYPPVPFIGRHFDEDTMYNGRVLPKELDVTIFTFGAHRNPDFFPDPDKFVPDRFSLENKLKLKPYSYIPFSAGPRNCVGQKFAMMELKAVVSKIVRTFKLLPVQDFEPILASEVILKSMNGILVKLETRNQS